MVWHQLPKLRAAGSSPVIRSKISRRAHSRRLCFTVRRTTKRSAFPHSAHSSFNGKNTGTALEDFVCDSPSARNPLYFRSTPNPLCVSVFSERLGKSKSGRVFPAAFCREL